MNKNKLQNFYRFIKILYIEDDKIIQDNIKESLLTKYKNIETVSSFDEAMITFKKHPFDIIITEAKIDQNEMFEFIKFVKLYKKEFPIIVLSGFSNSEYLIKAIKLNINDYLIKPIDFETIQRSIHNVIESIESNQNLNIAFENTLYFIQKKILISLDNSSEIKLTFQELKILELFLENPDKIITKEQIKEYVWDFSEDSTESAFKNLISKVRNKVSKKIIETKSNGYIFSTNSIVVK